LWHAARRQPSVCRIPHRAQILKKLQSILSLLQNEAYVGAPAASPVFFRRFAAES
jgi:hypothetical protein